MLKQTAVSAEVVDAQEDQRGLRAGRADLVAPAAEIDTARIGALYR